jgi:hypothetical protein
MQSGSVKARRIPHGARQEQARVLSGCEGATVTIYPDPAALREGRVLVLAAELDDKVPEGQTVPQIPHRVDPERGAIVVENCTGTLYVKW